ncbi:uncharacterized protein [Panulirus ornatus]|uniref:uncharacterized protein isoform X2 n=1 Tax=Panulirus ornatus TaxID=150431 RepID=UPI003A871263
MKCTVLVLLCLAALVAARPDSVIDIDLDDIHHDLDIADDTSVTGTYSWTSPEGVKYFVNYIADDDGYRVLDTNAVPVSGAGVRADGTQGSFVSSEELDDRK